MTFLVPLALLAGIGVGLPILAHLLSRYKVRRTDWAAMQFLTRSVRVRSRQIRLRDFLLLLLRCLVVALLVGALARPFVREGESALSGLGERRAGVLIALDTSFSMGYESGTSTRLQDGLERVRTIVEGLQPGDPLLRLLHHPAEAAMQVGEGLVGKLQPGRGHLALLDLQFAFETLDLLPERGVLFHRAGLPVARGPEEGEEARRTSEDPWHRHGCSRAQVG